MKKDEVATGVSKHSIVIAGHRTSVSLEGAFWEALKSAAAQEGCSLAALVARVDAERGKANLSSALRVFVLETVKRRIPTRQHAPDDHRVKAPASKG
jgi:predicted DNA-binding ribbon-helix-helix protein